MASNLAKIDAIGTSIIANNHAMVAGGLAVNPMLSLQDSMVIDNSADYFAGGLATSAELEIKRSTIAGNMAKEVAGASVTGTPAQAIQIVQSTISGNKSSDSQTGAGLYLG